MEEVIGLLFGILIGVTTVTHLFLNKIQVVGCDDRFEPGMYMQFVHRSLNMVAHRRRTDTHQRSNLPGAFPFR